MKVIKSATKYDTSTIIAVDATELKLFEMQKSRRVKTLVRKSIKAMIDINEDLTNAIKFAVNYHNTAYRGKIECEYTTISVKQKSKIKK